MSEYVARYLPLLRPGQEEPSKGGFSSPDEAWEYVYMHLCGACQQRAILSPGEFPYLPCVNEWAVTTKEDSDQSPTIFELLNVGLPAIAPSKVVTLDI